MNSIVIGRSEHCDVTISSENVSLEHARMSVDNEGHVVLQDLGSTNGTFVNGEIVSDGWILEKGQIVLLADFVFAWEPYAEQLGQKSGANPKLRSAKPRPRMGRRMGVKWIGVTLILLGLVGMAWLGMAIWEPSDAPSDDAPVDGDAKSHVDAPSNQSSEEIEASWRPVIDPITYDYSCMTEEDPVSILLDISTQVVDEVTAAASIDVPIEDEIALGEEYSSYIFDTYEMWTDEEASRRLNVIFDKLVATIESPRGFDYQLWIIDSEEINAFTAGGQVFFFRGLYEFVESNDELAAILAHEIQHNEQAHMNKALQRRELSRELFGDFGYGLFELESMLFQGIGQQDEVECDLHGLDHIIRLGYEGCAVSSLWGRMAESEEEDYLSKVIRSHPYSSSRKQCIIEHIHRVYEQDCHE